MKKDSGELLRGIFLPHLILFFHLLFIAGLGLVVIFFHGISQYMLWIFLGAIATLLASGFFFYRSSGHPHLVFSSLRSLQKN